jgi:hypothetical protein
MDGKDTRGEHVIRTGHCFGKSDSVQSFRIQHWYAVLAGNFFVWIGDDWAQDVAASHEQGTLRTAAIPVDSE